MVLLTVGVVRLLDAVTRGRVYSKEHTDTENGTAPRSPEGSLEASYGLLRCFIREDAWVAQGPRTDTARITVILDI